MESIIPKQSAVYQALISVTNKSKAVVFSGLPGVGKSLYINQFMLIAKSLGKNITVIQWDIARKAFETPEIFAVFPMGDGVIHNGVKLSVGTWLMETVSNWLIEHTNKNDLLLIEAPLVGHRFIELAKVQSNTTLENFLKSDAFQIIVPIPSKEVRAKIEEERKKQLTDDAKVWTGAKPAVMLKIWKMLCGIANNLGKNISMNGQPPYDPSIYEFVFEKVLKHRSFTPLYIDEIFNVSVINENELHNTGSLKATNERANGYAAQVYKNYSNEAINTIIDAWYLT